MNIRLKILLSLVAVALISCKSNATYRTDDTTDSDSTRHQTMTITEVLEKHTDSWLEIQGVVGTGEGKSDDKPCIMIFTKGHREEIKKKIPTTVDGYKVVFQETGEIKALDK